MCVCIYIYCCFYVVDDDDKLLNVRWDNHAEIGFCSKNVEIVFYAVYNTYKQIGEKAALKQNRSIMDQLVEDVSLDICASSSFPI